MEPRRERNSSPTCAQVHWIRSRISSEWRVTDNNRNARYYSLTAEGAAQLEQERAQWSKLSRGVELILNGPLPA